MEIDDESAELPSFSGDNRCLCNDDSSACFSNPISSSSSQAGFSSAMCRAVVCELALMGPVSGEGEVSYVLSCAANAAGGQPEEDIKALQAAALEWTYRSLSVCHIVQYADNEEEFTAYQDEVASYFALDTSTPGCSDALAELQSVRRKAGGWFNYWSNAELSHGMLEWCRLCAGIMIPNNTEKLLAWPRHWLHT